MLGIEINIQFLLGEVDEQYLLVLTKREIVCSPAKSVKSNKTECQQVRLQVMLLKINLPSYEGVLKDWPNIKDLFILLIQSNLLIII